VDPTKGRDHRAGSDRGRTRPEILAGWLYWRGYKLATIHSAARSPWSRHPRRAGLLASNFAHDLYDIRHGSGGRGVALCAARTLHLGRTVRVQNYTDSTDVGKICLSLWVLQESHIKSGKDQHDSHVRHQPFPESILEEEQIYTNNNGYQHHNVKQN